MLRYIHQFVQTFLKEVSKSRGKPAQKSGNRVEIVQAKQKLKPEISSSYFNNECQEAEQPKEILELKKTYSLLMKKFVNPKLDLTTNMRALSEINILDLKGKQEFLKYAVNKLFFESTEPQKHQPDNSSKEMSELDRPSLGWSKQPTSMRAANPMVESPTRSKNNGSSLSKYSEEFGASPKEHAVGTLLDNKVTSSNIETRNVEKENNNVAHESQAFGTLNENIPTSDATNSSSFCKNFNESVAEYYKAKKYTQYPLEDYNQDSMLLTDQNNHFEVDRKLTRDKNMYANVHSKQFRFESCDEMLKSKEHANSLNKCDESNCCAVCNEKVSSDSLESNLSVPPKVDSSAITSEEAKKNPKENHSCQSNLTRSTEQDSILVTKQIGSVEEKVQQNLNNNNLIKADPQKTKECDSLNANKTNSISKAIKTSNKDFGSHKHNSVKVKIKTPKQEKGVSKNSKNVSPVKENTSINDSRKGQEMLLIEGKAIKLDVNPLTKEEAKQQSFNKNREAQMTVGFSEPPSKYFKLKDTKGVNCIQDSSKSSVSNEKLNTLVTENSHFDNPKIHTDLCHTNEKKTGSSISLNSTSYKTYENKFKNVQPGKKNQFHSPDPKGILKLERTINVLEEETSFLDHDLHKTKSNKKLNRLQSKSLKEDNIMKSSTHKVTQNKQKTPTNRMMKLKKVKSESFAYVKSSENIDNREPLLSTVTNKLESKKDKFVISQNDQLMTSMQTENLIKKESRLNKTNFNSLPVANEQLFISKSDLDLIKAKHTLKSESDCPGKVKTEFDLNKPRKLHSKKDFCKPKQLQMYGGRRSIYTHSQHNIACLKTNVGREIITEPHLSSSVLCICKVNIHSKSLQVRNFHATGYRGKGKHLYRRKKIVVPIESSKIKKQSQMNAVPVHPGNQSIVNSSKCVVMKTDFVQDPKNTLNFLIEPNFGIKTQKTIHPLEDSCNPSSGCMKSHIVDKVVFSKSEEQVSKSMNSDSMSDWERPVQQLEVKRNNHSELELNVDLQNQPTLEENLKEFPKWKSKEDRLEIWRSEVISQKENLEAAMEISHSQLKNSSSSHGTKNDAKKVDKVKLPPFNAEGIKDNSEDNLFDCKLDNAVYSSKETMEKNNTQDIKNCYSDRINSTFCKNISAELEIKKMNKDNGKNTIKTSTETNCEQNKTKNEVLKLTKESEPINETNMVQKKDSNTIKIEALEIKLSLLESKVKDLQLKSIEENNITRFKNNTGEKSYEISSEITRDKDKPEIEQEVQSRVLGKEKKFPNKNDIVNTSVSAIFKNSKCLDKKQPCSLSRHLTQTVEALDDTIKKLETKVKQLKNKTSDLNCNKNVRMMSSVDKLFNNKIESKDTKLVKSVPVFKLGKVFEKVGNCAKNNNQIGGLNAPTKQKSREQKGNNFDLETGVVSGKMKNEIENYLKQNNFKPATSNKASSVYQTQMSKDKVMNYAKHANNQHDSISHKTTGSEKEMETTNFVKTNEKLFKTSLNEMIPPKFKAMSPVCKNTKDSSHVMDKFQILNSNSPCQIIGFVTNSNDEKGVTARKVSAEEKNINMSNLDLFSDQINTEKSSRKIQIESNKMLKNPLLLKNQSTIIETDSRQITVENQKMNKSNLSSIPVNTKIGDSKKSEIDDDTMNKALIASVFDNKLSGASKVLKEDKKKKKTYMASTFNSANMGKDTAKLIEHEKLKKEPPTSKVECSNINEVEASNIINPLKTLSSASPTIRHKPQEEPLTNSYKKSKESHVKLSTDNICATLHISDRVFNSKVAKPKVFLMKPSTNEVNKTQQNKRGVLTSKAEKPEGSHLKRSTNNVNTIQLNNGGVFASKAEKPEGSHTKSSTNKFNVAQHITGRVSTKKCKRKNISFIVDKKSSLKRYSRQNVKKDSENSNVNTQTNDKSKSHHEGMKSGEKMIKPLCSDPAKKSEGLTISNNKTNLTNQQKLTFVKNSKPTLLSTKLFKALDKLKTSQNAENNKNVMKLRKDSCEAPFVLKTELAQKKGMDPKSKPINRREKEHKNIDLSYCDRSKIRTLTAVHPIEKENYGLRRKENFLDQLFHFKISSQNNAATSKPLVKIYKSGRELAEQISKENENHLSALVSHANYRSKKTIQK